MSSQTPANVTQPFCAACYFWRFLVICMIVIKPNSFSFTLTSGNMHQQQESCVELPLSGGKRLLQLESVALCFKEHFPEFVEKSASDSVSCGCFS